MLARDRSSCANAHLHQLAPGFLHPLDLFRKARVKTDKRMQISVAGMKHICYPQLIFRGNLIGGGEHFG